MNPATTVNRNPIPATPGNAAARKRAGTLMRLVLLTLAVAGGGYLLTSWLAPASIFEGPMLQRVEPESAMVIWFLSKNATCEFTVHGPGGAVVPHSLMHEGLRYIGSTAGLAADTEYSYQINIADQPPVAGVFRTAKRPGQPFQFVVFGDSGRGSPEQNRLAAVMSEAHPDFLLHTGDLVYPNGKRSDYPDHFFKPYAALIARLPFWPCLGNHDVAGTTAGAAYREVFELPDNGPAGLTPKHNYWFDYAAARIIVLDSNLGPEALRDRVSPWVATVFTGCEAKWKFVSFHHPPYTTGKHSPSLEAQRQLVPAFEAAGVDIVFNGHDHVYERTRPLRGGQAVEGPGVTYVVTGAGGADLYELKPPAERPPYFVTEFNEKHSFTLIKIDGDELLGKQIAIDGRVVDTWRQQRNGVPTSGPATSRSSRE